MDLVQKKQGFSEEEGGGGDQKMVIIEKPPSSSLHHMRSFNFMGSSFGTHASIEKEHMFTKVVTPSDVGKLNRLVIPKQHAEKYFPLNSFTNEKGLQLNFEDREGNSWRFRYSYWNSSQSYVMTKGWSRFVKDKKLDAGDVVSFQRGVGDAAKDRRFFIDWQRRPGDVFTRGQYYRPFHSPQLLYRHVARDQMRQQLGNVNTDNNTYNMVGGTRHRCGRDRNVVYFRPNTGGEVGSTARGSVGSPVVFRSVPPKTTLRLFGVNMECRVSDQSPTSISQPHNIIGPLSPHQQPHKISQLRFYNGKKPLASTSKSLSMSLDVDMN